MLIESASASGAPNSLGSPDLERRLSHRRLRKAEEEHSKKKWQHDTDMSACREELRMTREPVTILNGARTERTRWTTAYVGAHCDAAVSSIEERDETIPTLSAQCGFFKAQNQFVDVEPITNKKSNTANSAPETFFKVSVPHLLFMSSGTRSAWVYLNKRCMDDANVSPNREVASQSFVYRDLTERVVIVIVIDPFFWSSTLLSVRVEVKTC